MNNRTTTNKICSWKLNFNLEREKTVFAVVDWEQFPLNWLREEGGEKLIYCEVNFYIFFTSYFPISLTEVIMTFYIHNSIKNKVDFIIRLSWLLRQFSEDIISKSWSRKGYKSNKKNEKTISCEVFKIVLFLFSFSQFTKRRLNKTISYFRTSSFLSENTSVLLNVWKKKHAYQEQEFFFRRNRNVFHLVYLHT